MASLFSNIRLRRVPAAVKWLFVLILPILGFIYFGTEKAPGLLIEYKFSRNLKIYNQTQEIARVNEFVTLANVLRIRAMMEWGVVREDLRQERCHRLEESMSKLEEVVYYGGNGNKDGVAYAVTGSQNLDVNSWVVDDEVFLGQTTNADLLEHERERNLYGNTLVLDRIGHVALCENYEHRIQSLLNKPAFDSQFVFEVGTTLVCIDHLTGGFHWDICPLTPFAREEVFGRRIYQKMENLIKTQIGQDLDQRCESHLQRHFGDRWSLLKEDMELRTHDPKRIKITPKLCSIKNTDLTDSTLVVF